MGIGSGIGSEIRVDIEFNSEGARLFDKITGENVGKRIAIVLDNTVYSAPVVKERISGGKAQISGSFSMDEAKDLAIVLRAGALPAPVKIIQNITIGPTLGQDSIRKGNQAAVLGAILVIIFMVFYYRYSGLVADIALFPQPHLSSRRICGSESYHDPSGHCGYHSHDGNRGGHQRHHF